LSSQATTRLFLREWDVQVLACWGFGGGILELGRYGCERRYALFTLWSAKKCVLKIVIMLMLVVVETLKSIFAVLVIQMLL